MKIVLNKCYGGFGVSKEACQYMADRGHQGAMTIFNIMNMRISGSSFIK